MADDLSRLVALYGARGLLERVEGDAHRAASQWLARARDDLDGVVTPIAGASYRLAYNAAYDTMRHAAEAVVRAAGARVTSSPGTHEAVFALANALASEHAPGAFSGTRAGTSRPAPQPRVRQ